MFLKQFKKEIIAAKKYAANDDEGWKTMDEDEDGDDDDHALEDVGEVVVIEGDDMVPQLINKKG